MTVAAPRGGDVINTRRGKRRGVGIEGGKKTGRRRRER